MSSRSTTRKTSDEETYVEGMDEDLRDVSGYGNVREVGGGTSGFVAIVDESVYQSLRREKWVFVIQRQWKEHIRTVKPRDTCTVESVHWKVTTASIIHGVFVFILMRT